MPRPNAPARIDRLHRALALAEAGLVEAAVRGPAAATLALDALRDLGAVLDTSSSTNRLRFCGALGTCTSDVGTGLLRSWANAARREIGKMKGASR